MTGTTGTAGQISGTDTRRQDIIHELSLVKTAQLTTQRISIFLVTASEYTQPHHTHTTPTGHSKSVRDSTVYAW